MAEVNLSINGRNYGIACDDGQERRVRELGFFVDKKIKEIARAGAANNDAHLLVLTALMLADEIYELREENEELSEQVGDTQDTQQDEILMAKAIDNLAERINLIAGRIQSA